MTPQEIRKLSSKDLISRYESLLTQVVFKAEDAILLKRIVDEIEMRKEIQLRQKPERVTAPVSCFTKYVNDSGVDICLAVVDRESVPEIEGLKKYSLSYAVNKREKFEGANMSTPITAYMTETLTLGETVTAKFMDVTPIETDGKFIVKLGELLSCVKGGRCANAVVEIIRAAHAVKKLKLTQKSAEGLVSTGLLKVDVDGMYGISLDKQFAIIKGEQFAKEGIFYAVVYPANEVDTDGDSASPEEVQKACWRFMEDHQRLNFMHKDNLTEKDVSIVECGVARVDEPPHSIKKGDWWMGVRVKNKELRGMIERGEITGFSMEGSALPGD